MIIFRQKWFTLGPYYLQIQLQGCSLHLLPQTWTPDGPQPTPNAALDPPALPYLLTERMKQNKLNGQIFSSVMFILNNHKITPSVVDWMEADLNESLQLIIRKGGG